MKTKISSIVIALIALFCYENASAQNCHQVGKLSVSTSGNTIIISGKVAGLGNVNETVRYVLNGNLEGNIQCIPPGQKKQDPGSEAPGLTTVQFSASGSGDPRNGSLRFNSSDEGPCDKGNGKMDIRLLNPSFIGSITIYFPDGTQCSAPLTL